MPIGDVQLQGVTIVAPVKATLQGLDYRRNMLKGVTIAVGTGASIMQIKVVDRNHEPIEGATCRVLNAISGSNNVLSFDGVDDYVIAPDLGDYTAYWTAEAWVKQSKAHTGSVNAMIVGTAYVSSRFSFMIGWFNGALCVAYFDGSWRQCNVVSPPAVGNWFHIAGVRDNNVLRVYINGQLNNSGTYTANLANSAGEIRIGRRWDGLVSTDNVFGGELSELRVWNTARSGGDILDNYQKRIVGDELNLYEYWPLDEGSGSVVNGLVGSNNGTIYGATWTEADESFPLYTPPGINYEETPYDSQTTNANGLTTLNYQIDTIHGLEVTLPGKRRFIMPFKRTTRGLLDWQVMLSDYLATFATDRGNILINSEPENNDANFLIE